MAGLDSDGPTWFDTGGLARTYWPESAMAKSDGDLQPNVAEKPDKKQDMSKHKPKVRISP